MREGKLVAAAALVSRGKGYLHIAVYNLLQRDAVVTGGLKPREVVAWFCPDEEDETEGAAERRAEVLKHHPRAFWEATRELLGREVFLQEASRGDLEELQAKLSDRVRGSKLYPGFPSGWKEFLVKATRQEAAE